MIKGVFPMGKYTTVSGGSPASPSIYNNYSGNQFGSGPQGFAGQVRYNPGSQNMEIFDGNGWQMVGSSVASVGLTAEAEAIIDWAREKRNEELDLMERMKKHPGLRSAYEQFKIMDALTLEEKKHVESNA